MDLPKNRKNDFSESAIKKRTDFLSKISGFKINYLQNGNLDPGVAKGNIENLIGFSQVPTGAIGPLKIYGNHANGDFFVPLSTTEGALISSFNRGARVISQSGGASVVVVKNRIQRAPCFELESLKKSMEFINWLEDNFTKLKEVAESTTNKGKLVGYHTTVHGKFVFVRLDFTTGDAMGMNMVSKATYEVSRYIENSFPVSGYILESNMAVDKKPAYINSVLGRGKTVTAEVVLKKRIISKYLHTTSKEITSAYQKQVMGGLLAGSLGANGHLANGIAALFLSCGQDLANVSESCVGYTYMEDRDGDLYVSIILPSLIVGTIGGGTYLPTQRECLEMMDCHGSGKSEKFAEIAAATALAGEISLSASIVAGDFITAHEKYGRNRPL